MPRRSEFTEAAMELIAEGKAFAIGAAKAKTPPPFMQESYTHSEWVDKFWSNAEFRDHETQRLGAGEVLRILMTGGRS